LRAHGGRATIAWCSPDDVEGVDQSIVSVAAVVGPAAGGSLSRTVADSSASKSSASSSYSSSSASGSS
jgi:hypothetical protein